MSNKILSGGRRRVVAVFAGLALAVAGIAATASVAAADRPAAAPRVAPAALPALVAPGTATLAFDWGCDGSYSTSPITFAANGTFNAGGLTGVWVVVENFLTFKFDSNGTTYSSVVAGSTSTGVQTTWSGLNGCHNLRLSGVPFASVPNTDSRGVDGRAVGKN
jgi:hypothetical protein